MCLLYVYCSTASGCLTEPSALRETHSGELYSSMDGKGGRKWVESVLRWGGVTSTLVSPLLPQVSCCKVAPFPFTMLWSHPCMYTPGQNYVSPYAKCVNRNTQHHSLGMQGTLLLLHFPPFLFQDNNQNFEETELRPQEPPALKVPKSSGLCKTFDKQFSGECFWCWAVHGNIKHAEMLILL